MASYRDLLARTKAQITEVDPAEADRLRREPGAVVLDVREPDEYEQGALPGAVHIPRGHLESQVEGRIIDHDAPVIVYCAGGMRSAFAARTLADLGYPNAVSMAGGFGRWKDEGREWTTPVSLSPEQRNRYQRHLLLPEVGVEGQAKLLRSRVLMLGAGGLGSPAALYLAAAGVGTIGIVDMDEVDASNLQRQILHNLDRIGDRKVDSAKKTLTAMNPDLDVVTYDTRLSADNVMELLDGYDVVIDGADNFPSRYLLNDASVKLGIPVVHGSIFRFEGMVTVFDPKRGPNYRDMVPEPPPAELAPSCAEAGVLGVLPGIIGSLQALEAIKLLLGLGDPLDRPHPELRRARADLPRVQAPRRPHQSRHLREPGQDPDPRARRALRPVGGGLALAAVGCAASVADQVVGDWSGGAAAAVVVEPLLVLGGPLVPGLVVRLGVGWSVGAGWTAGVRDPGAGCGGRAWLSARSSWSSSCCRNRPSRRRPSRHRSRPSRCRFRSRGSSCARWCRPVGARCCSRPSVPGPERRRSPWPARSGPSS